MEKNASVLEGDRATYPQSKVERLRSKEHKIFVSSYIYDAGSGKTICCVHNVLDFLGVTVDPKTVRDALANNTLQRMQEKEQRSPQLSDTAPKSNGSEESRFIRSGSVGGWRNRLTDFQVEMIEHQAGDVLTCIGYPTGSRNGGALESSASAECSEQRLAHQVSR